MEIQQYYSKIIILTSGRVSGDRHAASGHSHVAGDRARAGAACGKQ